MTTAFRRAARRVPAACVAAAAIALLGLAPCARADDWFWQSGIGGTFGDAGNWFDGAMFGVPGAGDTANFDVASIQTVAFLQPRTTDRVLMRVGIVTFDLSAGGTYSLASPSVITPGAVVGVADGDVATLELIGGGLEATYTVLGENADALGILRAGDPSAWLDNEQQLWIGAEGVGFFELTGGAVAANHRAVLGQLGGAFGAATIDGAGTSWTCDGPLVVADRGVGDLVISNGADVACQDAIIAQNLASMGSVTVRGAGATWAIDGSIDVGMNGFGTLVIQDGARVTNRDFASLGTFPGPPGGENGEGGIGEVVVSGAGSCWTIESGSSGGDLYIGFLSGGHLVVEAGGRVALGGDLSAQPFFGIEDPIEVVPASGGDYRAAPALSITGSANGSPLAVRFAEGFTPTIGDLFRIATAAEGLGGSAITVPDPPDGLVWGITRTEERATAFLVPAFCATVPGGPDDCNANGIEDPCEIFYGAASDCNGNGIPDDCDILAGTSLDLNGNGVPDECEDLCSADLDGDGAVGFGDLVALLAAWGPCPACPEDLDADGAVGILDLLLLLSAWGACP